MNIAGAARTAGTYSGGNLNTVAGANDDMQLQISAERTISTCYGSGGEGVDIGNVRPRGMVWLAFLSTYAVRQAQDLVAFLPKKAGPFKRKSGTIRHTAGSPHPVLGFTIPPRCFFAANPTALLHGTLHAVDAGSGIARVALRLFVAASRFCRP